MTPARASGGPAAIAAAASTGFGPCALDRLREHDEQFEVDRVPGGGPVQGQDANLTVIRG